MKTNHPENEAFSQVLRTWRVDAPLPPRFREAVWRRIEQEEAKSNLTLLAALSAWVESVLPHPKVALCYVTALSLVGIASGLWIGQEKSHRLNTDLGLRYVQSIDPFQSSASKR